MTPTFVDQILYQGYLQAAKPAMILPDRVVTFEMLSQAILTASQKVVAAGFDKHNLIGVAAASPTKHLALVCALLHCGVPSISGSVSRAISAGVKVDASLHDGNRNFEAKVSQVFTGDEWFAPSNNSFQLPASRGFTQEEVCRVSLTSGSTGIPKPVAHTLGALIRKFDTSLVMHNGGNYDRMLCLPTPVAQWGFSMAVRGLSAGKTVIFADTAAEALERLALYDVDFLVGSAQHFRELVEQYRARRFPLLSLRFALSSGSFMSQEMIREVRASLCSNLMRSYGATETGAVAYAIGDGLLGEEGKCGRIAPWGKVEVLRADGSQAPAGEEGEVRVRSIFQGQPYKTEREDKTFADGWFHPGDLGKITPDGILVITGRASELINAGGAKNHPDRVENIVRGQPGVRDVAAFAGVGPLGVGELWVAVVPGPDFDAERLRVYSASRGVRIDRVVLMDAIPRTPMGKVARADLRSSALTLANASVGQGGS